MAFTSRKPAFVRPDAPVTPPPATGGGSLYNNIILQKTNVSRLPLAMVPEPFTAGLIYSFGGITYYRFINANDNSSETVTTDITNADATLRVAVINRT